MYMGVLGGIFGGAAGSNIAGAVSDALHGSCKGKKGKAHHKCRKRKAASRDQAKSLGGAVGAAAGTAFEPFKHGGPVRGKKGAPRKAIVHGGEYVLPANAKPTAAQKRIVANNKKKSKRPGRPAISVGRGRKKKDKK